MKRLFAPVASIAALVGVLAVLGQPTPLGDAYVCYRGAAVRGPFLPTFVPRPGALVGDRFAAATRLDVTKPLAVCNPAEVAGSVRVEPATRLEAFRARRTRTVPAQPKIAPGLVAVTNQLGTLVLDVKTPERVLRPASGLEGPNGAPALPPTQVHDYACYTATVARAPRGQAPFPKFAPVPLQVADDFGARTLTLMKPTRLCTPADVAGFDPDAPGRPGQLVCYQAKLTKLPGFSQPRFVKRILSTSSRFGADVLTLRAIDEVCLPTALEPDGEATPTATPPIATPATATPTGVPTDGATPGLTATPTASAGGTPSATASTTPSPTASATPGPTPSPTLSATSTPSPTPTATLSATATVTLTPTATRTATPTPSATATTTPPSTLATSTATPTATRTGTPTATSTQPTATPTPTVTRTFPPTVTPPATATATNGTPTLSPTGTLSPTPTATKTGSPTRTPSPTRTATPPPPLTASPTRTTTPTATRTATPTATRTPTPTITTTATPTRTATPTVTVTPTSTKTATPTATKTASPTKTVTPTPTKTATPTATTTGTPTKTATSTPTKTASPTKTATPTPTRTATLTVTVSPTPTLSATPTATFTPSPSPTVTPVGDPVALDVNPDSRTINQGTSTFGTCVAIYANGATKNYTQRVTWSSSDATIASVSNVDGERGKITGNGPGTATISAHDPVTGIDSNDSNQNAAITVLGPLQSIDLTPVTASNAVGEERFFTAKGHFAGGTEKNITQDVDYSSTDTAVAQPTNEAGKKSRVIAVGVGVATIRATDPATGVVSNDATMTVTP